MAHKTLVLGLGVSGIAAAEFLLESGDVVIGSDGQLPHLLKTKEEFKRLEKKGIHWHQAGQELPWQEITRIVVSPGISPLHPLYRAALEKGIAITGEAEIALPHFNRPLVAVTGTNGKTTVTLLVEHVLNAAGVHAKALGNVGTALCAYLLHPGEEEAFVVELSSYQLETMHTPVFDAAVLANITPDHLDRYKDMFSYAQAKFQLQHLLKERGSFFVQAETVEKFPGLLENKEAIFFSAEKPCDLYSKEGVVHYREKIEYLMPIDYRDKGRHDCENALAAWALCQPFGISNAQFCQALSTFRKPPHRIEFVREKGGVAFYDDSKGTNIDAVIQAIKAMRGPVVLIAGGVDKGASYLLWKEHFEGKVKQIVAIGQAAPKIYRELHPYFNIKLADSLAAAVETAANDADRGDCVLLSPGCSSFDMFRDYAHRGEEFQRCVHRL